MLDAMLLFFGELTQVVFDMHSRQDRMSVLHFSILRELITENDNCLGLAQRGSIEIVGHGRALDVMETSGVFVIVHEGERFSFRAC